jgi:hypothetical protein
MQHLKDIDLEKAYATATTLQGLDPIEQLDDWVIEQTGGFVMVGYCYREQDDAAICCNSNGEGGYGVLFVPNKNDSDFREVGDDFTVEQLKTLATRFKNGQLV